MQGENFELEHDGSRALMGFFITVRVEAESTEAAGLRAKEVVEGDPRLAAAYNSAGSLEPTISVHVVHKLPMSNKMKNTDFVFFEMDED